MEPTFNGFHRCFIVKGPEAANQFCCLYVVFKKGGQHKEYIFVVAESILQKGYCTGTNHQMALIKFMDEKQLDEFPIGLKSRRTKSKK